MNLVFVNMRRINQECVSSRPGWIILLRVSVLLNNSSLVTFFELGYWVNEDAILCQINSVSTYEKYKVQ